MTSILIKLVVLVPVQPTLSVDWGLAPPLAPPTSVRLLNRSSPAGKLVEDKIPAVLVVSLPSAMGVTRILTRMPLKVSPVAGSGKTCSTVKNPMAPLKVGKLPAVQSLGPGFHTRAAAVAGEALTQAAARVIPELAKAVKRRSRNRAKAGFFMAPTLWSIAGMARVRWKGNQVRNQLLGINNSDGQSVS